jgi:permease MlaE
VVYRILVSQNTVYHSDPQLKLLGKSGAGRHRGRFAPPSRRRCDVLVHTYYGFNASGGPAGVGEAAGLSVRTSLIVAEVVVLMISLSVYGQHPNINLSG